MRRCWGMWLAAVVVVASSSCGGGGSSGSPKALSLEGLEVPTSEIVAAVRAMCGVAAQAYTDPGGSNAAFYAGPHTPMHQLAAILASHHPTQSQALISTMVTYEVDLTNTPPPPATGNDADLLLKAAQVGLAALRVPPPTCEENPA